jgi:hypothetical protein
MDPSSATLRYPPADPGLVLRPPEEILAANADLLQRLRLHAAVDADQFEARFQAPLLRLAEHVNVLPATASSLFCGEMGLFRACTEASFFAFQAADGRIFTAAQGVERRHALEGCWRHLCFIAALLHPLGRTLERIVVTAPDGQVWKRHFAGLADWAAQRRVERVFIAWGSPDGPEDFRASNATLALLPIVVGADNLQRLEDAQAGLVAALYQLAVGDPGRAPIAHQVVRNCWERILQREAARRPQAFARVSLGTQLGPYLAGALRTLVEERTWQPNASVLKADATGLYLQWPQAAADLIAFGRARGYAGWPQDVFTLAALLQAAGLVQDNGTELGLVSLVDAEGEIIRALPLANPGGIIEDFGNADRSLEPAAFMHATPTPVAAEMQPITGRELPVAAAAVSSDLFGHPPATQASLDGFEPPVTPARPVKRAVVPAEPLHGHVQSTRALQETALARPEDLVPPDLAAAIGSASQVQALGRIVKAWRERSEHSTLMRRVDTGAAIEFGFLTKQIPDVTTWVDCMARAGLVHAPARTPGLRIQKLVLADGRPAASAVVLSNFACRRLGL